ncbi:enolase C-terminal domain-like protein [Planctomycetaceae bacterium SH139]
MDKQSSDLHSYNLEFSSQQFAYRSPMKFGGRVVTDCTLASVSCHASLGSGQTAVGFGAMTMGVAWAWPAKSLDAAETLEIVLELARRLVADANQHPVTGHPLDVCWELAKRRGGIAEQLREEQQCPEAIPELAILLAASPLEAALFDAHGKALGKSSFALLGPEHLSGDLSRFLGPSFAGRQLHEFIATEPAAEMPLYHLVGALDPLDQLDELQPLKDGLPETLEQWIARDGLTHLKIKLDGADPEWDFQRVAAINHCAEAGPRGPHADWSYSLDFNERCQNEAYVLRLLDRLATDATAAHERIRYIEQPTHRDLKSHPQNTMHRVAERLPVVIDESLVDYESLLLARDQGYSGVAIKACKGHAEALLMAAAAQFHEMYLCVQDLTCIGASFLHSAALTAHLPGAAAIEGNGRQYCPAGNLGWEQNFPGMFEVSNGRLPTRLLNGPGLGY